MGVGELEGEKLVFEDKIVHLMLPPHAAELLHQK